MLHFLHWNTKERYAMKDHVVVVGVGMERKEANDDVTARSTTADKPAPSMPLRRSHQINMICSRLDFIAVASHNFECYTRSSQVGQGFFDSPVIRRCSVLPSLLHRATEETWGCPLYRLERSAGTSISLKVCCFGRLQRVA
jgi:hypothetical protein